MEISAEKTALMTNRANGIQMEIKVKGLKLDTVASFKYLGAEDGLNLESLSRIIQSTGLLQGRSQFGEITTYLSDPLKDSIIHRSSHKVEASLEK